MIVGYPENHSQKKIKGKVCQANDQMLYYEIKRQAKIGGMIIAERNGKFYVIGLHKENNPSSQKSVGLRLTPEKRERLNSWIGNLALKLGKYGIMQKTGIWETKRWKPCCRRGWRRCRLSG